MGLPTIKRMKHKLDEALDGIILFIIKNSFLNFQVGTPLKYLITTNEIQA